MRQVQIEKYAGIDPEVAQYMMNSGTEKASHAMGLLKMAISLPEIGVLTLLKLAVEECKADML